MTYFSRLVWRVSLPIILAGISETLLHLIDTIFLARVGIVELGALAIADSALLLVLVLPLGVVEAVQILTARRAGQRKPEAVGAIFNQGFLVVALICIAATAALKLCWPLVSHWFVESPLVASAVGSYLQIAAFGIVLTGANFAYSGLLTITGKTRALIPATAILAATSISLSYVFIFGKFGLPALGMRGAALGSVGAEGASFLYLTLYVLRAYRPERYKLFRVSGLDWPVLRMLGRFSSPIIVQQGLEAARWFVFFLILERVGGVALAIANIVYTCYIVFWIPTEGFSETAYSMVSRYVGRNQPERIGRLLHEAVSGALLATVPFLLLALFAPRWFVGLFSPEWTALAGEEASLRVVAVAMLVIIPGEMWFRAVLGTGDTSAALGIELILTATMLGIAYLIAIPLAWPVNFVWLSLPIAWAVCLVISYLWMKSKLWQRLEV